MKKYFVLSSIILVAFLSAQNIFVYNKTEYDKIAREHLTKVYNLPKIYLDSTDSFKNNLLSNRLSIDEIHSYSIPLFFQKKNMKNYQCGDNILDYIKLENNPKSQYYIVYANDTVYSYYWTLQEYDDIADIPEKLKTLDTQKRKHSFFESILLYDYEIMLMGVNKQRYYYLIEHPDNFYFQIDGLGFYYLFMIDKSGELYVYEQEKNEAFVKAQEYFDKNYGEKGVLALINHEPTFRKKFKPCKSKKDRVIPKMSVIVK